MYILLKPLFSRHKGIGVQFTDEPTGSLDEENKQIVIKLLKEFKKEGCTIIMVTHDIQLAEECDRVIDLNGYI